MKDDFQLTVIDMVDTKMETACNPPANLQLTTESPMGQYLVRISMSVSGIVSRQSNKSLTAKLMMKTLRRVRIAGCRMTAQMTIELPKMPSTISVE